MFLYFSIMPQNWDAIDSQDKTSRSLRVFTRFPDPKKVRHFSHVPQLLAVALELTRCCHGTNDTKFGVCSQISDCSVVIYMFTDVIFSGHGSSWFQSVWSEPITMPHVSPQDHLQQPVIQVELHDVYFQGCLKTKHFSYGMIA